MRRYKLVAVRRSSFYLHPTPTRGRWRLIRRELEAYQLRLTRTLKDAGVCISMDGRGRWMENIFTARLWLSFINAFDTGSHACNGIGRWINY